jgi:hypothetical protein
MQKLVHQTAYSKNSRILEIPLQGKLNLETNRLKKFHWNQKKNQRIFLESISAKLGIKNDKDWGRITLQQG